ncbi:MAG TPA: acido-empty-quinoprotein group A [Rhizomicrobium sp.]|nr:acido-empty-quinoprotein group A [Rhizomicrobium sp.]
MKLAHLFCAAAVSTLLLGAAIAAPVHLDPKLIGKTPIDSWTSFAGDFTGQRYSTLKQINAGNVGQLAQQWVYKINDIGSQRGAAVPVIKATPILVNGTLFITIPNHVYALDARTAKLLWQYDWVDKGGHLVGQRGVAVWKDKVFFQTPDNWLVAMDANTGKELWKKNYADARKQYFSTSVPLIVKNHLLVGVGGDAMDMPGFLNSYDPDTGELQWTWWSTPRKGDPALKTWPNERSSEHGGGMTWLPGTYDAKLNLLYWPTGNTNPVFAGQGRPGNNLWTESLVALNPDTGKLKWYFQVSPHDTHDFDNNTAPILFDKMVDGKKRQLVSQAARNGVFFTLDRVTGKKLVVKPFVPLDYISGYSPDGEPIPIPDKDPQVSGSINIGNATNWPAPTYSPDTGYFYVNSVESKSIYYLVDDSDEPSGYGGTGQGIGVSKRVLKAIDPLTGEFAWTHTYPNLNSAPGTLGASMLTTASNLLVTGDDQKNLIVMSADKGEILWHKEVTANESNGPITYMMDGKQWLVMAAGDSLYAFTLSKTAQ